VLDGNKTLSVDDGSKTKYVAASLVELDPNPNASLNPNPNDA
jgi:hypothetical protein